MNVEEPPSGDPDPLEEELLPFVNQGAADGRIVTEAWAGGISQTPATVPSVRFRNRWVNVLWLLPIAALALLLGIAVAQQLRTYPWMQDFLVKYPGTSSDYVPEVNSGFPWWLRWQHFFNVIFMMFIISLGLSSVM